MQDNVKHNNIHVIGMPEREEEQSIEKQFEKIMIENFPNLKREKVTQIQETQKVSIKKKPNRSIQNLSLIHISEPTRLS